MATRYPNHRLVKIHRSYTVTEVASLLNMHKNTVRRWIKDGLPTIHEKRPKLILGQELKIFLKARRAKKKQRCKPGQFYCVRCRTPKFPAGDMVEYSPVNEKSGRLTAICPDCDSIINQYVSLAKIRGICEKIDVTLPRAERRLVDRT